MMMWKSLDDSHDLPVYKTAEHINKSKDCLTSLFRLYDTKGILYDLSQESLRIYFTNVMAVRNC